MNRKAELLAPAGSYETMMAAFHAGADAVYIGGQAFGARAYADNPDEEMLRKAIRYAHLHGRQLYLTVNTLVKQEELDQKLVAYLKPYYEEGLDAVIVQDPGVLHVIRDQFPGLPIHASTQMTMSGPHSAAHLESIGVSRIVTPRELSLEEIREIRKSCSLEIESFVHGALCYCYSGQCLFSSIAGGRSGNRGRCAQPCRLPYQLMKGEAVTVPESLGYLLSPKDLNTIAILPKLLEAGVYSLKIEGRMKKPEYTSGVVSIYRKYLDHYLEHGAENYRVSREDEQILFDLFNRKGFTDGYYLRHNAKSMITFEKPNLRRENEELNRSLRDRYIDNNLKENIKGKVKIFAGEPVIIETALREFTSRSIGEEVMAAQNRPLTKEDIRRSMEKIRDTDFQWESLTIETDGTSFYPVGRLNELRRQALLDLEEAAVSGFYRRTGESGGKEETQEKRLTEGKEENLPKPVSSETDLRWSASAESREQLDCLISCSWIDRIYLDSHMAVGQKLEECVKQVKKAGKECFLMLPKMIRREKEAELKTQLESWKRAGFDGYLTASAEGLFWLRKHLSDAVIAGDHSLYCWSREAELEWKEWGLDEVTAPVELNGAELKRRGIAGMELIVYGHLPMMISAQCLHRSSSGCIRKQEDLRLKDRLGNCFPVRNYCSECYNIIYNNNPLSLLDVWDRVRSLQPRMARISFTVEDRAQTMEVLSLFEQAAKGSRPVSNRKQYTRGHWKRGVE